MAEPFKTLIYVNRLTQNEKAAAFNCDDAFPSSGLKSSLLKAVEDVCIDRLIRAEGSLKLARQMNAVDEETQRAAIGRAYYSIHHSLRAMALWKNKWDADGHEESLKEFKKLLEDNDFRHISGLAVDDYQRVAEARTNRHVADYSPYDVQRDPPSMRPIRITNGAWSDAVQFNINLANEIFQAALRCVGQ